MNKPLWFPEKENHRGFSIGYSIQKPELFPACRLLYSHPNSDIICATISPPPVPITYPIRAISTPTGTNAPL